MFKSIVFTAFVIFGSAQALACDYTVKPHETLSDIAYHNYPNQRLYGKNGSLAKLLKFNSDIRNQDELVINQVIKLPELEVAKGQTECKAVAFAKHTHRSKHKVHVAKVQDNRGDDAPVVHKVKQYHHKLVSFSFGSRGQNRSPASIEEIHYQVPEAVMISTPEVIFQHGLLNRQVQFKLPLD
jgi:hypothetical protein